MNATITPDAPASTPDGGSLERICPKCGQGGLPPRYRVHDECLSSPKAQRLRERIRRAGHEYVRANQRDKFDRMLATVSDAQLDVWSDRAADAINSAGEEDLNQVQLRNRVALDVASIVFETVEDPGKRKSTAKTTAATS